MSYMDNSQMTMYTDRLQMWGMGSQFDTASLIDVELEMIKMRSKPLINQQGYYKQEKQAWASLKSKLDGFTSDIKSLRDVEMGGKAVNVSDDSFATVTASGSAIETSYSLSIQNIAKNHKIIGDSKGDATKPLGYDGTVQINGIDLTFTADMSMNDLATKVNDGAFGAKASVISGHLVLNADGTGLSNAISLTDSTGASKLTVSNDSVLSAQITGTPVAGTSTHSYTVGQLADKQMVNSNAVADKDVALGYTGTFTLDGVSFNVDTTDSLQSVVDKVNADANVGVKAKIDSNNKLIFESKETGSVNAFSLTDSTSNGTDTLFQNIGMLDSTGAFLNQTSTAQDANYTVDGVAKTSSTNVDTTIQGVDVTLKDLDAAGTTVTVDSGNINVFEDLGMLTSTGTFKNEVQKAEDAQYTIDGISLTSEDNSINDAVTGVTIDLVKPTTENIKIDIREDKEAIKDKMNDFVKSYNKTIMTLNSITDKGASLQGKSIPTRAKMDMSYALMTKTESKFLPYQIGLEMDGTAKDGTIKFDSAKFNEMLDSDSEEVMKLISGRDSFIGKLHQKIDSLTKTSGSIDIKMDGLDRSIKNIDKTLDRNEEMFERQKEMLVKKYAAFESMMAQLNAQSEYMTATLASLSSSGSKK